MGIQTYPDAPRVYLDMDGVIADFDAACASNDEHPDQFKHRQGAFVRLAPLAGAKESVALLQAGGIEVFVLTKIPSANPYAATEKMLWLHEHFPSLKHRVIISPDKGCVGTYRDVLVDDHPEWANANNFPGAIVKFDTSMPSQDAWQVVIARVSEVVKMRDRGHSAAAPVTLGATVTQAPTKSRFQVGDWVASDSYIARVKNVHTDGSLDLVLYERSGQRIGRESPALDGPRGFEPCCAPERWRKISRPSFPLTRYDRLENLVDFLVSDQASGERQTEIQRG